MSRYNDASRYVAQRRVSLLVRNLPLECSRAEELRSTFERFGEVRDVYLPRDYYTQRPKGFGFIEFRDQRDAEEAMYQLDRSMMGGREITVVLSKENRKSPREMLKREDTYGSGGGSGSGSGRGYGDRGRSYGGSSGDRRRRSRSPDNRRRSPRRREGSYERRYSRERSYSRSKSRSPDRAARADRSPPPRRRSPSVEDEPDRVRDKPQERGDRHIEKDRSRSPVKKDNDDYSD